MRARTVGALLYAPLAVLLAASAAAAEPQNIPIAILTRPAEPPPWRGPLDETASDEGIQGARLGTADNNTTGRFTGQRFELVELVAGERVPDQVGEIASRGVRFVVADLPPDALLEAADAPGAADLLFLNARASDDRLRNEDCRANVVHTLPSRAMLADALAQYLVAKQWRRWLLVTGRAPEDRLYADAIRRAAARFGGRIVADKPWSFQPGHPRADTGHVALQTEIPALTRVSEHDVLVVADERGEFGEYLAYRTALPRPVVGTHGLVPTAWSAVHEQWGATQLQNRFRRQTGRWMTPRDYGAWLAVRAVGEAAVRTKSADPAAIAPYLRGPDFVVAGFKGQGLSFRPWDGQLRQPILLAGPRLLVSASPQPGFLHQFSELDTLGHDSADTRCRVR